MTKKTEHKARGLLPVSTQQRDQSAGRQAYLSKTPATDKTDKYAASDVRGTGKAPAHLSASFAKGPAGSGDDISFWFLAAMTSETLDMLRHPEIG